MGKWKDMIQRAIDEGRSVQELIEEALGDETLVGLTTCSYCGEVKSRIFKGVSPNGTRRYYTDQDGRHWKGTTCPDCIKNKRNKYYKEKGK